MTRKVPSALQGGQAARWRRAFARPLELLDDPETVPRLTPEERDLRAKVAEALGRSKPAQEGRVATRPSGNASDSRWYSFHGDGCSR